MKRVFLPILLILSLSVVFAAPKIIISNVAVSDSSIHAGDSGSVSFIIQNTGDLSFNSIGVTLTSQLVLADTHFSFDDFNVGDTRFITTTYKALNNTPSGSYSISLTVNYDSGDTHYGNSAGAIVTVIPVNYLVVDGFTSSLVIDDITKFYINVTNQGSDTLDNVLLNLVLPDGFIPTTGSQFYFNEIRVGETVTVSTDIYIEKNIKPDAFQFSLEKSAKDFSGTDMLNVVVRGVPELAFSGISLDPQIPLSGTAQTISVQVENVGSGKAYNVVAQLFLNESAIGRKVEYLGSLDREDLSSAIFDLQLNSEASMSGNIIVSYIDDLGVTRQINQDINFDVLPAQGNNTILYVVIGGVLLIGYVIYRVIAKKKR
ncbi:Uncharacterised protein [Candidatus Tiddalikarchaeum anstoanum]|nr:Uncharacterised protein [Candidatus Tiddalikarchaeum anstoanum]